MPRMHAWLAVSLISVAAVGCTPNEKYIAARMDADQANTRLATVEREKDEAAAARDAYKQQLDKILLGTDQKDALVINQSNQISDLQRRLSELQSQYDKAAANVGQVVMLPPELNAALKQFAGENPDVVDFDSNRGIVKFKSDVTFSAGSAVLTPTASSAIDRFASILNLPAAKGYELMVVGHTDNVRVAHDATLRAGHKDNWYLSCHRAISVSSELQAKGVSSSRLEVAGFADQRPIASNTTDAGKAQNRRVEVLIMPSTTHNAVAASPAPAAPLGDARPASAKTPAKAVGLNKDENKDTPEPKKPGLNK